MNNCLVGKAVGLYLLSGFIVVFLGIASCSNRRNVEDATAPEFSYADQQQLRTNMQLFAYQLQLLNWAMENHGGDEATQQQTVLRILRRMKDIGGNLQLNHPDSSHGFLQSYVSDFLIRVDYAISEASQDLPSYYIAGKISGGCTNCHRVRDRAKN